jgi:DNA-binding transcriptional LysR family regulator
MADNSNGLTWPSEDCRLRTHRPIHWTLLQGRPVASMLDLNDFFYFVRVVERGGFTAAGRALGIPKSTLSYRLQQLEAKLGVRLLNRNSRHFAPTQAGEEFYRHALGVVSAAETAESLVRQRGSDPGGVVRFTAAIGLAQFALRDILMSFVREHPKINLVEYLTSRQIDLLAENFDVAVRAHSGTLADSTLVSRTLAQAPWILVAGTDFFNKTSVPQGPEDLKQYPCLFVSRANTTPTWRLYAREGRAHVIEPAAPRLISNDMSTLKRAAVEEVGIVALPAYLCKKELRGGQLTRVLPDWHAGQSTFTALLPHRRGLLPAVKLFVDYLARHLPEAVAL